MSIQTIATKNYVEGLTIDTVRVTEPGAETSLTYEASCELCVDGWFEVHLSMVDAERAANDHLATCVPDEYEHEAGR